MAKQNKETATTSKAGSAAKRVKAWDGGVLHGKFITICKDLHEATAKLADAVKDIAEFTPELDQKELTRLHRNPAQYFADIDAKALEYINQQRPIHRQHIAESADQLITAVKHAWHEWKQTYQRFTHGTEATDGGRHIPAHLRQLEALGGLFGGFTDKWFESVRDDFNEYLESPQELALLESLERLAAVATEVAQKWAKHPATAANPIPFFLEYHEGAKTFAPQIDGIKRYTSVYEETPIRQLTPVEQLADKATIAREYLTNLIWKLTATHVKTDEGLLAATFPNGKDFDQAREHQKNLRNYLNIN